MKLLLDTHTFLWMDSQPTKLSATAMSLLLDPQNELNLSVASLWEIQIKSMLGKIRLRDPLPHIVADNVQQNGLVALPITAAHVYAVDQLPAIHKDPFDRLLVAVALTETATLVSADPVFRQYRVAVEW
jgi:PIN domain nuclease of toxin-antitoxin system